MNRLDKLKTEVAEMDSEQFVSLLYSKCNYCMFNNTEFCDNSKCKRGIITYLNQVVVPDTRSSVIIGGVFIDDVGSY